MIIISKQFLIGISLLVRIVIMMNYEVSKYVILDHRWPTLHIVDAL